jgi:hypothetical protein
MAVRVHKMNATMRVVDGDSLLTAQVLDRIIEAVTEAMDSQHEDERSLRRDTRIGALDSDADEDER